MPITWPEAIKGTQLAVEKINDGYSSAVIVDLLISGIGSTRVEANRIYARAFECTVIQSRIRSGGYAGMVNPRSPMLPSNPDTTHRNDVAIVVKIERTGGPGSPRRYSFITRGVSPVAYFEYEAQLNALINSIMARYSTASVVVLDPCAYIY